MARSGRAVEPGLPSRPRRVGTILTDQRGQGSWERLYSGYVKQPP